MILGIDLGYSSTKFVVMHEKKIVMKEIRIKESNKSLPRLIDALCKQYPQIRKVAITGGNSSTSAVQHTLPVHHISEIVAIGTGALFLAREGKGVVLSCGTGTCMVYQESQESIHIGGTGIGGGTLLGLGKLLLGTEDVEKITTLAKNGDNTRIDVTIQDIIGGPLGMLPPEITAANFGKVTSTKKEDIAHAIVTLVAEGIASVGILGAQLKKEKQLYLCGRVVTIPLIYEKIEMIAQLFACSVVRVPDAPYAPAVGAALIVGERR
ncbi:hypothetical protein HYW21_07765 [Candidatus Woesearchaeota archaeon]|nr:hypothetical protein [Candidatus Woesearchaeota archaeon]